MTQTSTYPADRLDQARGGLLRRYPDYARTTAADELISVRTGCFCNPGDGEVAHEITRDEMAACFADPTGKVPHTIRVSLGLASDFGDVYRFLTFAEKYRDLKTRGPAMSVACARADAMRGVGSRGGQSSQAAAPSTHSRGFLRLRERPAPTSSPAWRS